MKPSQRIQEIRINAEENVLGYPNEIEAIIQYMDEEYEKNDLSRHPGFSDVNPNE